MKRVCEMNQSELNEFYAAAKKEYEACKAKGLSLNMARGKPSAAQLELSNELLTILKGDNCIVDGIDARNYGTLEGLPSCRRMFADILGVDMEEVFAAGSASLTLMYDTVSKAYTHGMIRQAFYNMRKLRHRDDKRSHDRRRPRYGHGGGAYKG